MAVISKVVAPSKPLHHTADLYMAAKEIQASASLPNHQLNCYRALSWKCYRSSAELLQSISRLLHFGVAVFENVHVDSYVARDWIF